MSRLFHFSSPGSYSSSTRKLRIHGHSTSIRLERGFWDILEQMARAEGKSLGRLVTALHDEMRAADREFVNFSSCLRVMALHYGAAHGGTASRPTDEMQAGHGSRPARCAETGEAVTA